MKQEYYTDRGLKFAVALANASVDPQVDFFEIGAELLQDSTRPRHRPPTAILPRDRDRLARTAEQVRFVFESDSEEASFRVLNQILLECDARPVVTRHGDSDWHLHFAPDNATAGALIGATAAISLATFMCDYGTSRIGICRAEDCYMAYSDPTKNNRKLFCSSRCATRTSVAAHRRREVSPP